MLKIKRLEPTEYQALIADTSLLEGSMEKPRVLVNHHNKIIKHFYKRKTFSSSLIWPYAVRFTKHSLQLQQAGIKAAVVEQLFYYPDKQCHVVVYDKIPGEDLRACLKRGDNVLPALANFLAQLHNRGIFFRSIHLGNILKTPEGDFALLDFTDLKIKKSSLSERCRQRNLKHLFENRDDKHIFDQATKKLFLDQYIFHHKVF